MDVRIALSVSALVLQGCAGCAQDSSADEERDAADGRVSDTDSAVEVRADSASDDGVIDVASETGCEAGSHLCGAACESDDSPKACGLRCDACPAPPRMIATCVAGACGVRCADGYDVVGSDCVPSAPRPIAPLSGSIVTTRRPMLSWKNAGGLAGAHVEICASPGCTTVAFSADVTGSSYAPPMDLAVGLFFWRVRGRDALGTGTSCSPTWEASVAGARDSSPHATAWGSVADYGRLGFASAVIGRVPPVSTNIIDAMQGPSLTRSFEAGDGERLPVQPATGDMDGDGLVDLAVGIAADGDPLAPKNGRLDVYLGPSKSSLALTPSEWWYGTTPRYALTVAFAGDVDSDGYGDLALSDPEAGQGEVHLLPGGPTGVSKDPTCTLLSPDSAPSAGGLLFGDRIAGAGDLNGDGHADLAIHDNYKAVGGSTSGHVFVYFGDDHGFTTPPILLAPPVADANFGNSLHIAGDVNGDGLADLLVADANDGTGDDWVYVYFGSTSLPFPTSPAVALHINSTSAVPIGDFNADGYSDIAVLAGGVTIYGGGPSGPSSATILGAIPAAAPGPYDLVGGIGDVDADGFFDLGIVNHETFYGYAGGTTFSPTARWTFCGPGGIGIPCYTIGLLGGLD